MVEPGLVCEVLSLDHDTGRGRLPPLHFLEPGSGRQERSHPSAGSRVVSDDEALNAPWDPARQNLERQSGAHGMVFGSVCKSCWRSLPMEPSSGRDTEQIASPMPGVSRVHRGSVTRALQNTSRILSRDLRQPDASRWRYLVRCRAAASRADDRNRMPPRVSGPLRRSYGTSLLAWDYAACWPRIIGGDPLESCNTEYYDCHATYGVLWKRAVGEPEKIATNRWIPGGRGTPMVAWHWQRRPKGGMVDGDFGRYRTSIAEGRASVF